MSGREIKLTDNEWEIYECLWENSPLTLVQIAKRFSERTGLARSTAETMVARMEKKGLLYTESGGRAKLFFPILPRGDAVRMKTRAFLEKVFGGKPGLLMSAMAESGDFSKEEIDELYRIIKEARAKHDD